MDLGWELLGPSPPNRVAPPVPGGSGVLPDYAYGVSCLELLNQWETRSCVVVYDLIAREEHLLACNGEKKQAILSLHNCPFHPHGVLLDFEVVFICTVQVSYLLPHKLVLEIDKLKVIDPCGTSNTELTKGNFTEE